MMLRSAFSDSVARAGVVPQGMAVEALLRRCVPAEVMGPAAWLLQVVGGFVLVALAAQARVPLPGTDVPGTLQLLAVLLLGLTWRRSAAVGSVALYLACGGLGLGVLAPGSVGLLGPTGGYLFGFVPAVIAMAWLRGSPGAGWWRPWCAGFAGACLVLGGGVIGRCFWFGDWSVALVTGLLPFLTKSVVEVSLAVLLVRGGRKAFHRAAG